MARLFAVLIVAFLLLPKSAFAHSAIPGFEGFYLGILHPLKEAAQGLAIAALGLFVAQHPSRHVERASAAFLAALIVGLAAAFVDRTAVLPETLFFFLALVTGVMVAIARPVGWLVLLLLAAAIGFASGMISMPDPGGFSAMAYTIAGSLFGAALLFLYAFGGAHWAVQNRKRPWLAIGLRVLGSWIAAACALMLALAFRS